MLFLTSHKHLFPASHISRTSGKIWYNILSVLSRHSFCQKALIIAFWSVLCHLKCFYSSVYFASSYNLTWKEKGHKQVEISNLFRNCGIFVVEISSAWLFIFLNSLLFFPIFSRNAAMSDWLKKKKKEVLNIMTDICVDALWCSLWLYTHFAVFFFVIFLSMQDLTMLWVLHK